MSRQADLTAESMKVLPLLEGSPSWNRTGGADVIGRSVEGRGCGAEYGVIHSR